MNDALAAFGAWKMPLIADAYTTFVAGYAAAKRDAVPADIACLTALVWEALGDRDPVAVAEWSLEYGDEENR